METFTGWAVGVAALCFVIWAAMWGLSCFAAVNVTQIDRTCYGHRGVAEIRDTWMSPSISGIVTVRCGDGRVFNVK